MQILSAGMMQLNSLDVIDKNPSEKVYTGSLPAHVHVGCHESIQGTTWSGVLTWWTCLLTDASTPSMLMHITKHCLLL